MNRHDAICDYFQLDPAHYGLEIKALEEEQVFGCYRITWLNGSIEDYNCRFEDDVCTDAYMYNKVI